MGRKQAVGPGHRRRSHRIKAPAARRRCSSSGSVATRAIASRSPGRRCRTARWISTPSFRFLDIASSDLPSRLPAEVRRDGRLPAEADRRLSEPRRTRTLMSRITFRVGKEVLDLPPETHVTYHCDLTAGGARGSTAIWKRTSWRGSRRDHHRRERDGEAAAAAAGHRWLRADRRWRRHRVESASRSSWPTRWRISARTSRSWSSAGSTRTWMPCTSLRQNGLQQPGAIGPARRTEAVAGRRGPGARGPNQRGRRRRGSHARPLLDLLLALFLAWASTTRRYPASTGPVRRGR